MALWTYTHNAGTGGASLNLRILDAGGGLLWNSLGWSDADGIESDGATAAGTVTGSGANFASVTSGTTAVLGWDAHADITVTMTSTDTTAKAVAATINAAAGIQLASASGGELVLTSPTLGGEVRVKSGSALGALGLTVGKTISGSGWEWREIPLSRWSGQTIQIDFAAETSASDTTAFYLNGVETGSLVSYSIIPNYFPTKDSNGNYVHDGNGNDVCAQHPVSMVQANASHELVEAITDPFGPATGFADLSLNGTIGWDDVGVGEASDLCEWDLANEVALPNAHNRTIEYAWSNEFNDCQMYCGDLAAPTPLLPADALDGTVLGSLSQPQQSVSTPTITLPNELCRSPNVTFGLKIVPTAQGNGGKDYLNVNVVDVSDASKSTGGATGNAPVATFTGLDAIGEEGGSQWYWGARYFWADLAAWKGDVIYLTFTTNETGTSVTTYTLGAVSIQ